MIADRALTLRELEDFDPNGGRGAGDEGDWCCPLCGDGKPQDARHRSLSANRHTGAWNCHRCGAKGCLREFWPEREPEPRGKNTRARKALRRRLEVCSPTSAPSSSSPDWRKRLPELLPLTNTEGAHYLIGRGIPVDLAHAAGVRYSPRWEHWTKDGERWELEGVSRRVVFPLRDRGGRLVGIQGRAIGPDEFGPKMLSRGSVREGAFITPGALEAAALVICEAPVDALSLFVCGLPALGTTGCNILPDWLVRLAVGRRVLVATDADEEGDRSATAWSERLTWARQLKRFRPVKAKDWNELLQRDGRALRDLCAAALVGVSSDDEEETGPVEPEPAEVGGSAAPGAAELATCDRCRRIVLLRHLGADGETGQQFCVDRTECHEAAAVARWRGV